MWNDFGFRRDLYDTHPVKADDEGERLLVGRTDELRMVKSRIQNRSSVVTVEGPNGVGKTSLVLVAGHQLDKVTRNDGKASIVVLPRLFQIDPDETAIEFKRKVYGEIASFMLSREGELRSRLDLQFNMSPLRAWLEQPLFHNAQISVMGSGGGGSRSVNTSSGFDLQGFFTLIDRLLRTAFNDAGGIICILDNLEVLNTSHAARQKLEQLRDDVFSTHGIRWVVCGARGIVRSVASTPRLQGRLLEPIEISPLRDDCIPELISARVEEYRLNALSVPPVGVRSFEHIFMLLNSNLRDALKYSGDFALWLNDEGLFTPDGNNLYSLFESWLADLSERYEDSLSVPPRAWKLFDEFCGQGGAVSPSDFESFDFNSAQNMRGQVSRLEDGELVVSEVDETDHRRKTIVVTAKGWLIHYKRAGYIQSGSN